MTRPLLPRLAVFLFAALLPQSGVAQDPWVEDALAPGSEGLTTTVDTTRGRIVGQDFRGRTWSWTGSNWTLLVAGGGPLGAFDSTRMTYDSGRDRVVWYDGDTRETWEFDGSAWDRKTATTPLVRRFGHRMAYDPVRQKVVLHGGQEPTILSLDPAFSDTWEWDGSAWTLVTTAGPVSTRHGMAFDPNTGKVLLFGRRPSFLGGVLPETWTFDGSAWTQVATNQPASGVSHLTLDTDSGQLVAFVESGSPFGGDCSLWAWDGSNWSAITGADDNCPSLVSKLEYDPASNRIFAFSQVLFVSQWTGSEWVSLPYRPFSFSGTSLSFDRSRGRMLLVTGVTDDITWEADDKWIPIETPGRPSRIDASLVYDEMRGVSVLYGGNDPATGEVFGETWEWDGTAWTLASNSGPSRRDEHAAAYDVARGEMVVFGGVAVGVGDPLAPVETWTWDGTAWSLESPSQSPGARRGHAMAYDRLRQRVVLFGGSPNDASTWEWDGDDWIEYPAAPGGPGARFEHQLAYDEARGRVVMHGGGAAGFADFTETWEWDGGRWQQVSGSSPDAVRHTMTYDVSRRRVRVMRDQTTNNTALSIRLDLDTIGSGCGSFEPTLNVTNPRPAPNQSSQFHVGGLPSTGTVYNLAGFEPAAPGLKLDVLGLPGCELLIGDPLTVSTFNLEFLVPAGELDWSISIPDIPEAVNVRVVAQSIVESGGEFHLSKAGVFVIDPPASVTPTVAGVDPISGPPGTTVTVSGDDFTVGSVVVLDGIPLPTTLVAFDELTFTIPASVSCDADLTVQNPGGQMASTVFNPSPTILTEFNNAGPASGGGTYVIVGDNLDGATVTIGGTPANIVSSFETTVIMNPPPGSVGVADVIVTTPGGCSVTTTYTYL